MFLSLVRRLTSLHDGLMGGDTAERFAIILRSSVWDLRDPSDDYDATPNALAELADELAARSEGLEHAARVPELISYLDLTAERLQLALEIVESGVGTAGPLAHFDSAPGYVLPTTIST